MRRLALLALAPLFALAVPAVAQAHAHLVSATPAANGTVTKPTRLTLTFSEPLVAPLSGIELTMTGMPGMASHQPMPIKGFATAATGAKLTITMPRALPAGSYLLKWHVVTADQHRVEGQYTFTVR